ncbi:RNA-directed DNA polymerase, eukaryota, reverse transcriptase zinc-binding domain protein [Tanacetum coccineum]
MDIFEFVNSFFVSGLMPQGANSSFFTLIPKTSNPISIKDFCPISLIGIHYKIIAKVLANRISKVIDKVVSKEQSAFIYGRQILDDPLIISEVIQWYKKKILIFKVDFEKAFNSVSWKYLDYVLLSLGFGSKWRSLIRACLQSSRASILINGSPTSEFSIKRGLLQGDPLSSFLFILAMEGLHGAMSNAVNSGLIRDFPVKEIEQLMARRVVSSPNHPTSDIEDVFSSNFLDYILASPDYFPASSRNTSSESSNNSFGLVPIASPTLSLFHNDPYMKVMQAYDAISPPRVTIPPPTIVPPYPVLSLSPMFDSRDFFPPEEIPPPKDTETPVKLPIPISLSSSVGSSSPVRSTTPPPDYPFDESIFAEKLVADSIATTLEEVVNIAQRLMDQVLKHGSVQGTNDHKRKFDDRRNATSNNNNNRKNDYHQQQNRRQESVRTHAATSTKNKKYAENKRYAGNLPWCTRCTLHHTGICIVKCQTCNKVGHQTKNYRNKGPSDY